MADLPCPLCRQLAGNLGSVDVSSGEDGEAAAGSGAVEEEHADGGEPGEDEIIIPDAAMLAAAKASGKGKAKAKAKGKAKAKAAAKVKGKGKASRKETAKGKGKGKGKAKMDEPDEPMDDAEAADAAEEEHADAAEEEHADVAEEDHDDAAEEKHDAVVSSGHPPLHRHAAGEARRPSIAVVRTVRPYPNLAACRQNCCTIRANVQSILKRFWPLRCEFCNVGHTYVLLISRM